MLRNCLVCKQDFKPFGEYKTRIQKYCSKDCWNKRSPPAIKNCLICNKLFSTYEKKTKFYCSNKCRNKSYSIRFTGSKSHLWKGGKTIISILMRKNASYRNWRKAVMERDGYKCVLCGKHDKHLESDHIKPVSERPDLIYEINNGRTLCRTCHLNTDTYGLNQYKRCYNA